VRVLFDNGVPRGVAAALIGHAVEEARSRGWDTLKNGELLTAAEAAGFDVFVTTDQNLRHQQNLLARRLAIIILSNGRWKLIKLRLAAIQAAVTAAAPGAVFEVAI
jgi:tartrate dehydratase beta subunit/fumarate hydratase class I family protein